MKLTSEEVEKENAAVASEEVAVSFIYILSKKKKKKLKNE